MAIYFYKVKDAFGCFSNFSPHAIYINGQHWQTVEHYYQAQKFVNTKDQDAIQLIWAANTPEYAAALGRDRTRQIRPDWELVNLSIMREAVLTKFLTHLDIQKILLSTGDQIIIEDSPTDYYWGCGLEKNGQNHLGKILVSVREEIRKRIINQ